MATHNLTLSTIVNLRLLSQKHDMSTEVFWSLTRSNRAGEALCPGFVTQLRLDGSGRMIYFLRLSLCGHAAGKSASEQWWRLIAFHERGSLPVAKAFDPQDIALAVQRAFP